MTTATTTTKVRAAETETATTAATGTEAAATTTIPTTTAAAAAITATTTTATTTTADAANNNISKKVRTLIEAMVLLACGPRSKGFHKHLKHSPTGLPVLSCSFAIWARLAAPATKRGWLQASEQPNRHHGIHGSHTNRRVHPAIVTNLSQKEKKHKNKKRRKKHKTCP